MFPAGDAWGELDMSLQFYKTGCGALCIAARKHAPETPGACSALSVLIHLPDDWNGARACISALPRELLGHVAWHYATLRSAEHLQCQLASRAERAAVAQARIALRGPAAPFVLCADPIHLTMGRDRAYLEASAAQLLTESESQQFLATLNAHFSRDGVQFFHHPAANALLCGTAWCATFAAPLEIHTATLAEALDSSAAAVAPTGAHARRLRVIETEVQMLLYNHPVNQAREARGERAVNSVWFWGEADATPARTPPELQTFVPGRTVNFCHIPRDDYRTHARQAFGAIQAGGLHAGLIFRQHFCWTRPKTGAQWRFWQAQDWRLVVEKFLVNQLLVRKNP